MTDLDDLTAAIGTADGVLVFEAPGGAPAPGYHITELRLVRQQVLDCGGGRSEHRVADMQLLSGFGRPMTAARFLGIASAARTAFPGIEAVPLRLEVPLDSGDLALMTVASVTRADGVVTVWLRPLRPMCRPRAAQQNTCCAPKPQAEACCVG